MGLKSFKDLNININKIECSYSYGNINDRLTYKFISDYISELSPYRIDVILNLKYFEDKITYLRIFLYIYIINIIII